MVKEKPKNTIWLSIESRNMMRDSMKALIKEIKDARINYTSYGTSRRIYLKLENVPKSFDDNLSNWVYYQPVRQLPKAPNVSDYDRVDW